MRSRWPPLLAMPRLVAVGSILAGSGLLAACGERSASDDRPLLVSAASDLRFAFREIGAAFEEETGTPVTFNFGSTGVLARQIEQGAPVDVFAAANASFVDDLVERGHLLEETRALYARGFLVIWSREDGPDDLHGIEDLARPEVVRVAIANPDHAPYGMAAREALEAAGLWERLQPRLILGENVNQALQYAQTGNVDAAIVALSLALAAEVTGGRYVRVPEELHAPIDQALGVVAATRRLDDARAFARFVNGPVGRPIMERYGFVLPAPETP